MAIDFPSAGLVVGQLFTASNGVTYRWDGTLWLVTAGPGGGTGDFMATVSANFTLGAAATVLWDVVQIGNAGLWYSTSTGRYSPPAGRYTLFTEIHGRPNAATGQVDVTIRKNGVAIASASGTGASLFWVAVPIEVVVDANGTDWFDVQGTASVAAIANGRFLAFPLTGMQGPAGPPGSTPTGDFFATGVAGALTTSGTPAPLVPPTIISGNTTSAYSTSTGRYTPPAGRYYIFGNVWIVPGAAGITLLLHLYKNGVLIPNTQVDHSTDAASVGYHVAASLTAIVDATGTDYFELRARSDGATSSGTVGFGAFPISGIKGPQGDPGTAGAAPTRTKVTKFPVGGTFTPDVNCVHGFAVGTAGGGSSGATASGAGLATGGGGGGEGNTVTTYFTLAQVSPSVAVTIGAGGSGTAGGDTIFGSLITAKGGGAAGGYAGGQANTIGNVGDIVRLGATGGWANWDSNTSLGIGGVGGGSGGGQPGVTGAGGAAGTAGQPNSGGGGGGTGSSGPGGPYGAATGGSGYLYVVEYLK